MNRKDIAISVMICIITVIIISVGIYLFFIVPQNQQSERNAGLPAGNPKFIMAIEGGNSFLQGNTTALIYGILNNVYVNSDNKTTLILDGDREFNIDVNKNTLIKLIGKTIEIKKITTNTCISYTHGYTTVTLANGTQITDPKIVSLVLHDEHYPMNDVMYENVHNSFACENGGMPNLKQSTYYFDGAVN